MSAPKKEKRLPRVGCGDLVRRCASLFEAAKFSSQVLYLRLLLTILALQFRYLIVVLRLKAFKLVLQFENKVLQLRYRWGLFIHGLMLGIASGDSRTPNDPAHRQEGAEK